MMEKSNINVKLLSTFGQAGSMFGVMLPSLMKEDCQHIMVLSADMSTPAGLDKFKSMFPSNFMNFGIAEQNMIGAAAGLSDEGYKTISVAQACFITMRCFEPVRQYLGYMQTKQILVGLGSGFSLSLLGNTHYALEDIALMKTIPGMTVVAPSDALQAMKVLQASINHDGPVYIRLFGGSAIPIVYADDFEYQIGKAICLKQGKDIQLIATGSMVSTALEVAEELSKVNIDASVVDMHTIKPLDCQAIDLSVPAIVSMEEHFMIGGLGDSIASYLAQYQSHPALLKIGVNDTFSVVGESSFVKEENGLSCKTIVNKIKTFIN